MLWIKLAFALEGLILSYLQAPRENGVWIYDTFGNNFGIKTDSDPHFLFRYALNSSFHLDDFSQNTVCFYDTFGNNFGMILQNISRRIVGNVLTLIFSSSIVQTKPSS